MCDGNLKEAPPPPPQGMVVEIGWILEGVKAKMSSEGQEMILKKRDSFLGVGDSMCKEHDQREPGIWVEFLIAGRKGWMEKYSGRG